MIEDYLRRPRVVAQLRASVLGPDLDELTDELERLGYAAVSVQNRLHAAGHVAYWLRRKKIGLESLNEATIRHFVQQHLPRCRCPVPRSTRSNVNGVAPHLLRVLRARRRIPVPDPPAVTPIDAILSEFAEHLRTHRGAAAATCERYIRETRPLLVKVYGTGPIDFSRLSAAALREFVSERAARHSPRTARGAASALRNFLRFLHMQGLSDGRLVPAVPTVKDTRRSTLPVPLTTAHLRQLLASIDQTKPVGLRNYAMVLCMAHIGLRAKEVAQLSLDEIDWRVGTLRIATGKARRASVLPLPKQVGKAIAAYLRRGRPPTTDRKVFVRHIPPVGMPLRSPNVTNAVHKAFHRADLDVPSRGAHTLRHTVATEMVRAGVDLKAVADILGHRSLDTTALYTKIDLPRLREVALPWPEGQP